ncbi:MAG: tetratricopeptide repeat protein [Jaaginema sp. PMC 1079.18]|nr:tetratricopeptide repeat protein [Jaaginema sp. PMC 1080.18]MEC4852517.1 tetratricopeptide repeat protein [Jaaginema sp. PMC 1079.18]MEC4865847.1 tetratricopeptide repeat protein [Jaaginema sp. PMC 1078.18]
MNEADFLRQVPLLLLNQDYENAIALCEMAIATTPEVKSFYFYWGLAHLLQGDEVTAQMIWLGMFTEDAASQKQTQQVLATILESQGQLFVQQKQWSNAELLYRQLLECDRPHATVCLELGYLALQQQKFADAIAFLHQAIDLNPQLERAYFYLGECDKQQNNLAAAIEQYQKAVQIQPDFALAHYALGICWHDLGKLDEAIAQLQLTLNYVSDATEVYYNLGYYCREAGQIENAIAQFQKALEIEPNFSEAQQRIIELQAYLKGQYAPPGQERDRIWDAIVFQDEDCDRLYYLLGDSLVQPFWKVGELHTAISQDFSTWEYQGAALKPLPEHSWESGRMLAGSIYKEKGNYYFFYSAASAEELLNEKIGLATSTDGINWTRSPQPLLEYDPQYYTANQGLYLGKQTLQTAWRDPYIIKENGKYHLFITAFLKDTPFPFQACIGLATADKITGPYQILPPIATPLLENTNESIFGEMERPQIIPRFGKYYLFFCAAPRYVHPQWQAQVGTENITMSSLYWYVSDTLTGNYRPIVPKPIVKNSDKTNLYGMSLQRDRHGNYFACGCYHKSMTLAVSRRFPVRWTKNEIEIVLDSTADYSTEKLP